ncbi:hypothetical protein, partial [Pseudomonas tohonis]|uniref:hypothetical protein n=1 Tax=Pseudomonas tohonis TaxID=2725477 RepID=UPI001F2888D1
MTAHVRRQIAQVIHGFFKGWALTIFAAKSRWQCRPDHAIEPLRAGPARYLFREPVPMPVVWNAANTPWL